MNKKALFIFAYLILVFKISPCQSQSFIYEPIGVIDKPLPTLTITNEIDDNISEPNLYLLDTNKLSKLNVFISGYLYQYKTEIVSSGEYQYGSYSITVISENSKQYYTVSDRNIMRNFLKMQLIIIDSNKRLRNDIESLIKRLN